MSAARENREFQWAISDAPEKNMQKSIAVGDLVNISGVGGVWTVIGARVRNLEPKYQVQLGKDESTVRWFQSDAVTLMQKAALPDEDLPFSPTICMHEFQADELCSTSECAEAGSSMDGQ
jgi:hypothetical protein